MTNTADTGAGSLRQAILDANGNAGRRYDRLQHRRERGPHDHAGHAAAQPHGRRDDQRLLSARRIAQRQCRRTRAPTRVLRIEVNGQNLGFGHNGLVALAPVTIRGLAINRAFDAAILFGTGANGSITAGNFLGTDPAGSAVPGSQNYGVNVAGATGVTDWRNGPGGPKRDRGQRRGEHLRQRFRRPEHRREGQPHRLERGRHRGPPRRGSRTEESTSASEAACRSAVRRTAIATSSPAIRSQRRGHRVHRRRDRPRRGRSRATSSGPTSPGSLPIPNSTGVFIPNSNCVVKNNVIAGNAATGSMPTAAPTTSSRGTSSAPTRPRRWISATATGESSLPGPTGR